MMAADLSRDKPLREALILGLGETISEGKARLKELRKAQLDKYLKTLEAASIYKHGEAVSPALQRIIDEGLNLCLVNLVVYDQKQSKGCIIYGIPLPATV